jgi:RHS repeat-associated protein
LTRRSRRSEIVPVVVEVERYDYSPYGEVTVYQETGFGDYDGDGDVDSTDRAAIEAGGDCLGGSPPAACAILDLGFDGNWDSDDRDAFDNLPQGLARHPGLKASGVDQPFAHQGLLFEPEIGSYQNRARQYDPRKRRFVQRDPAGFADGLNRYMYLGRRPTILVDPGGRWGSDVHYNDTYMCMQTKLTATVSCIIASADNWVDDTRSGMSFLPRILGGQPGRHFDRQITGIFGAQDSRRWYEAVELANAKVACRPGVDDWANAAIALDTGLHSVQDWWAHGQYAADVQNWPDVIWPHDGTLGPHYDDPEWDVVNGMDRPVGSGRPPEVLLGPSYWMNAGPNAKRYTKTRSDTLSFVMSRWRAWVCANGGPRCKGAFNCPCD